MEPFAYNLEEKDIKRERRKARELRNSQWWKRRCAKGVCHYCGRSVPPKELTMDHIVPIARGGRTTKGNVVSACKECNNAKKQLLPVEWEQYLKGVRFMRIVTRPDFDGVVCAALLYEAENVTNPVKWVEPNDMQRGLIDVQEGDIIANLPYHEGCSLWFDHHHTNRIDTPFKGVFKIAPSAAGVIFEHYKDRFARDYAELVKETDKIDSADLSLDEVLYPENYPYILLSMTILGRDDDDEFYWNRLVDLLRKYDIDTVLEDPEVKARCNGAVENNKKYKSILKEHTKLKGHVSITDFRGFDKAPAGNRFLVYSMYSEAVVSVKIFYDGDDKKKVAVSVGHSIFNRNCNVNVGLMLSGFEGGGHRGAGSCRFHVSKSDDYIPKIIDILLKNKNNEN